MGQLTFYQQTRSDGGVRTGVSIDGIDILQDFQEGDGECDPALLWYIDLRFEADSLPQDVGGVRDFLLVNSDETTHFLTESSDELQPGFDPDIQPYRREGVFRSGGCRLHLLASAVRRIEGREIARRLKDLAGQWNSIIEQMAPLSTV